MPGEKQRDQELPWDLLDRCLLPVLFSHAAAVILSTVLNTLYISQIGSFALFILIVSITLAVVLFYHNLKVSAAGKAVLLTGCETRVGSSLVRQLDDLGFTVFAGFSRLDEDSTKLKEESSGRVHFLALDVTSEADIRHAVRYVQENLPIDSVGLWAVVNQAAMLSFGEVDWLPLSVLQKTISVNLVGSARVTQAFLPLLRKAKGRVVYISSLLGRVHVPFCASFCAAQAGLEAFSSVLAQEMRQWGVDVVVVEPGQYTTGKTGLTSDQLIEQARDMWHLLSPELRAEYGEDYFERRVRSLEIYTKGGEADLSALLRSLTDAVTRSFPLPRYTPVTRSEKMQAWEADLSALLRSLTDAVTRSFPLPRYTPVTRSEKMQAWVADHLPRSVYDILYT